MKSGDGSHRNVRAVAERIAIGIGVLVGVVIIGSVIFAAWAIATGEEQRQQWRHDVLSAWQKSKSRSDVYARLGEEPTFTTRIDVGRLAAPCDVYNAYDQIVDGWVQFPFCYTPGGLRIPSPDPLEPNDDVAYLRRYHASPLTRPARPSAKIHARLDDWPKGELTERLFDTEDVYRVWVPSRYALRVRVEPTADVDLEVWDASTPSVYVTGNARNRHLITFSDQSRTRSEEVTLSRGRGAGAFVYVDVYLLDRGPNHAEYVLTVTPIT